MQRIVILILISPLQCDTRYIVWGSASAHKLLQRMVRLMKRFTHLAEGLRGADVVDEAADGVHLPCVLLHLRTSPRKRLGFRV